MKYIIAALLVVTFAASAQTKDYSKDVASIDATIATLYDVISGDPGAPRDWDRFRYLFQPEAQLLPTRKTPEGILTMRAMKPEEYIQFFTTRIINRFFRKGIISHYRTIRNHCSCIQHLRNQRKERRACN